MTKVKNLLMHDPPTKDENLWSFVIDEILKNPVLRAKLDELTATTKLGPWGLSLLEPISRDEMKMEMTQ